MLVARTVKEDRPGDLGIQRKALREIHGLAGRSLERFAGS
jgi:hypothetical protein